MPNRREDPRRDEVVAEEAAAWLARLRADNRSEQDCAAFEEWYCADPRHAAAYDAALDGWDTAALADATRVGRARSRRLGGAGTWRRYGVGIAAAVALVLLAFSAYGAGFMAGVPGQTVEFASRAGEIRQFELADGSHVTLDEGSLLQTAYSSDERRLTLLRGRARFAVAYDQDRPLVVSAGAGLVIAHGTVFDTALEGERLSVSLLEGSVEVRAATPSDDPSGSSLMLGPGQRTVLTPGSRPAPPMRVSDAETRWTGGMLTFDNAPLGEVIAAANRHGPTRIVLADPALARLRFTGTFEAAKTRELARMVAAMFDLRQAQADNESLVLTSH